MARSVDSEFGKANDVREAPSCRVQCKRHQSGPLDILLTAVGPNETVITFSELDRYSEAIEIENGLLVRTASLDDVIRMKEAADRVKDHQALPELRRLRGDPNPEHPRDFDPFVDLPIDGDGDEYEPD